MVTVGEGESMPRGEAVELANQLAEVIEEGSVEKAKEIAETLASHRVKVNIEVVLPDRTEEPELSVRVYVEDKVSSGGYITLRVRPSDTVGRLKEQVEAKYNFPAAVQNWIIGLRMPRDKETLRQCGVKETGHIMFLYLVSSRSVGLTKESYLQQQHSRAAPSVTEPRSTDAEDNHNTYMSMDYHLRDVGRGDSQCHGDTAPDGKRPTGPHGPEAGSRGPPPLPRHPPPQRNVARATQSLPKLTIPTAVTSQPLGWSCPTCTLINIPTRPGCAVCGESRPADYQVPANVELLLPEEEQERLQRESQLDRQAEDVQRRDEEAVRTQRQENYLQLLETNEQDVISNTQPFQCLICYDDIPSREGVVLRECLHTFCRDCLKSAIEYTEEVPLKCPFQDEFFSCDGIFQEREIRGLVDEDSFERYLQRSLQTAESQAANSYHCQTRDCQGWCIYEDFSNFFHCPVCGKTNCVTCKAIHEGMNCKEYQEDIRIRAENDVAARQTQILVQKLLADGDAMHCPRCLVIVQKKEGCDWLRCSICKTEICWVTKGPRWGPNGEGDTTGGCQCKVSGEKCHPQCNNCH